jgi:uncharacterized protein (DUF305 family)
MTFSIHASAPSPWIHAVGTGRSLIIALALALGVGGCQGARSAAPAAPAAPSAAESNAAAMERARADSARYPYTAADIRFMTNMIAHHAQAIAMSRLALTNGASASVRTLAERIINAQQDEITIMRQWLADRGQAVPQPGEGGMAHSGHSAAAHEMQMPGLLTAEQMKQLEEATGAEFDRLFLIFMIQHHRGAIAMVKELIGTPGAVQDLTVFKLASDVHVDQTTEVARMAQMLFEQRPP